MPTTKSAKASKSRSTSKRVTRRATRKPAKKAAKEKTTRAAKAGTKAKGSKTSKKSVSQKKATKLTSAKTRAKRSGTQPTVKKSVGLVAKAKSVLKPVLAGAAAAAAVITGKNPDSNETEQAATSPNVSVEASQKDSYAEEPTPNPQWLKDGVLLDRRR